MIDQLYICQLHSTWLNIYNATKYDLQEGRFFNICVNDVKNLTAKFRSKICHDVQVEPTLRRLTMEI